MGCDCLSYHYPIDVFAGLAWSTMIIRDLIDQLLAADATMNSSVHVCINGDWRDIVSATAKTDGEGGFVEINIEGNY